MKNMKIGFIGCGNMATAMIDGILKKGICSREEIIVSNKTEAGAQRSREKLGVTVTLDNREVVQRAKLLVLAVKPQFYEEVLTEVREDLSTDHMLIGIAPGKTLAWLEEISGKPMKIVRLMPNTPAKVGEGMTGVCINSRVTEADAEQIREITDSFGRTEFVPERLMDAVGAVSGSSPAFVFMFIEAMADGAVAQGMPRSQAYAFAAQAVLGSAKLVLETGMHPGELKDMVCSPAGTTIEGVRTLEKAGFRSAVLEALQACAEKGKRL
jgi:pyrroline-5-carboxylate reductase